MPFTSLMLYVYQKHTVILILHLIIAFSTFLGTFYCFQATLLIINEALSISISNIYKKHQFWAYNCWQSLHFVSIYKFPNQIQDEFESFSENLELNLANLMQRPILSRGNQTLLTFNQTTCVIETKHVLKVMESRSEHPSSDYISWLKSQSIY